MYEHTSRIEAMGSIVDRWDQYTQANPTKSSLMLTYRNVDVLAMNLMARERLQEKGHLLETCISISTTAFGKLEFAEGDKIMFLRNERSIDVKNGLLGRIDRIDDSTLTVTLDRGNTVVFNTNHYNDLGYGYAATIHKTQGETIDQSFVLASPQMDRFLTNVALDRHRDNVELHYGKDDFLTYDNLKRTLSRGESKVLAVEFAQARGLEYETLLDTAAQMEAHTDFALYHQKILSESVDIEGTLAERYLKNQGLENINVKSLLFHPAVWEKETQSHMPALIAKAVGQGDTSLVTKGIQVTYLDTESGNKATLDNPVRYSGSSDAIIMLQKPSQIDSRWYVAAEIETALAITKANPDIHVACLATQERFDHNPLKGNGKKELIFCASADTQQDIILNATHIFVNKDFKVSIAHLDYEITSNDMLKNNERDKICQTLDNPELIKTTHMEAAAENEL